MVKRKSSLLTLFLLILVMGSIKTDDEADDDDSGVNDSGEEVDGTMADENEDEDETTPTLTNELKPTATKRVPLECYSCVYKSTEPLWACLNPKLYRIVPVACLSINDKCFTSIRHVYNSESEDPTEIIERSCAENCVESDDTTCCSTSRCNDQLFGSRRSVEQSTEHYSPFDVNGTTKLAPTMFFYVTILLILQTIAKVSIF